MDGRRNNFDGLRLFAAFTVMLTHSFLIGEGRIDHDPLMLLTRGKCTIGVMGVFVFFVVSGYLVTQSCETTGSIPRFLIKRALRIYPGLAFCLVLLAFVLGPLETSLGIRAYLADPRSWGYVASNLAMHIDWNTLPGVRFTGWEAGAIVNGPLWSLPCEVLMYLMVAALAATGMLRLRVILGLIAAGLVGIAFDTSSSGWLLGSALWMLSFFAAGMALYKLRAEPIFASRYALVALLALALAAWARLFIPAFALFGSYLVVYLAFAFRRVIPAARFGDLSYGLYIYGWPAEQAVTRALGGAAPWWQVLGLSLPIAVVCAFCSWHLVEAPALRLKPRGGGRPVADPQAA
ncbi:MAG TPA: acyltransferase [Stellaceae bacterium]|nr:acyltransferase [Stellaceae bacterium]